MKTIKEALAWVYAVRSTFLVLGDLPDAIDEKLVSTCRETGVVEEIPLIALEHRRLHAVFQTSRIPKDFKQQLDLLDRMDALGNKLIAKGWNSIQLTANALNTTVERAKESVAAGIVSAQYGVPASG